MKGMKKLCVCMFMCICFFAVSVKNVAAGPLVNFIENFRSLLLFPGLLQQSVVDAIEDAEDTSLHANRAVSKKGIFIAARELHRCFSSNAQQVARIFGAPQSLVDALVSAVQEERTESGHMIIRFDFYPDPILTSLGWAKIRGYIDDTDMAFFAQN
jgi:hypothetical protein